MCRILSFVSAGRLFQDLCSMIDDGREFDRRASSSRTSPANLCRKFLIFFFFHSQLFFLLFFKNERDVLGATATQIPECRGICNFLQITTVAFRIAAAGFDDPRNCALRSKTERLIFDMLDFIDLPGDRNRHFRPNRCSLATARYGTREVKT